MGRIHVIPPSLACKLRGPGLFPSRMLRIVQLFEPDMLHSTALYAGSAEGGTPCWPDNATHYHYSLANESLVLCIRDDAKFTPQLGDATFLPISLGAPYPASIDISWHAPGYKIAYLETTGHIRQAA